jgi:hypothetical protein
MLIKLPFIYIRKRVAKRRFNLAVNAFVGYNSRVAKYQANHRQVLGEAPLQLSGGAHVFLFGERAINRVEQFIDAVASVTQKVAAGSNLR